MDIAAHTLTDNDSSCRVLLLQTVLCPEKFEPSKAWMLLLKEPYRYQQLSFATEQSSVSAGRLVAVRGRPKFRTEFII